MSLFQPTKQDASAVQVPQHPVPYRPAVTQISVGIQTDYRETAIQTDPWTADVDKEKEAVHNEAILNLEELTYANGLLPAHQETLNVIERIMRNKEFEKNIPPPVRTNRALTEQELAQEELRSKMLIEQSLEEWDRKEREIAKQQGKRIKILIEQLQLREQAKQDLRNELLDKLVANKQEQLENATIQLSKKAVLELKKSTYQLKDTIEQQQAFSDTHNYSDRLILQNYRNDPVLSLPQQKTTKKMVGQAIFGANSLNAPILKPGEAPYRFAGVIRLAGTELKTQQDFDDLLKFQNTNTVSERLYKPHKPDFKKKRNYQVYADNDYLPTIVRKQKKGEPTKEDLIRMLDKDRDAAKNKDQPLYAQKMQEVQNAQTLQSKDAIIYRQFDKCPDISQQAKHDAFLYIQNLIRGRAAQKKLEQGKDRRIGLVRELRLAHNLVEIRGSDQNLQKLAQDRLKFIQEAIINGIVVSGVSNTLGQTINQLEKERQRSQQLLRTEAILQIAIRERQRREQLESTQRQKEVMHRSRKDYNREVIQNAHREFVDMFIDRIAAHSKEADAEKQAKDLALREVEAIVEFDYQSSVQGAKTGYQEQLQQYLNDFLLPEVDRKYQADKLQKAQQKWLYAGLVAKEAGIAADKYKEQQVKTHTDVNDDGVMTVNQEEITELFKGVEKESEAINRKVDEEGAKKKPK